MSDIKLDLTGLIFLATVAVTGTILLLVGVVAGLLALRRRSGRRARRVAANAAVMGVVSALVFAGLFDIVDHYGSRPEWIDMAAVPWLALFAACCWRLTRV